MQVSPFRDLRVNGYLLLTAAYRSLSRLSSALSAKASTLRSCSLNLTVMPPAGRLTSVYIALYTQVILVQKFLMIVYNHQLVCITKTDLVLATSDVLTIFLNI